MRVSALMITPAAASRPALLAASLARLGEQTRSIDEIVVVAAEPIAGTAALERELAVVRGPDVVVVPGPIGATLGALRNMSVAAASGELLCQWDDDDLPHRDRVRRQIELLDSTAADAVYLSEVWQFFPSTRELFWTTYRRLPHGCHPGTGMFRAARPPRYPTTGEPAQRGEDTAACLDLMARGKVAFLEHAPELFVYVSHGANTWNADHHRMLARELGLSRGLLARRADVVSASLAQLELGPEPIQIMGSNGPAFVWHPATRELVAR